MFDLSGDESDMGTWYGLTYGTYTIEPTDETSGVINMINNMGGELTISYKDYDGENCTFDLQELVMASEPMWVEYTLGTGTDQIVIVG